MSQAGLDRRHQPFEADLIIRPGARDEGVRGVRGAQQPPAVGDFDAPEAREWKLSGYWDEDDCDAALDPVPRIPIIEGDGTDIDLPPRP